MAAAANLTIILQNTKTLLPMAWHPAMTRPRRLRHSVTRLRRPVRITLRSRLPGSPGHASSDDQTKKAAAFSDQTKTSSENNTKVKAARKPRREKADSQRDEMSDSQSDPSLSPTPPPCSPTALPPSNARKFTAKKPDRQNAKLANIRIEIARN